MTDNFDFNRYFDQHKDDSNIADNASHLIVAGYDSAGGSDTAMNSQAVRDLASDSMGIDFWSAGKAYAEKSKFIPGSIYFFTYKKDQRTQSVFGTDAFWDIHPVILCLHYERNKFVDGINFNLLPNKKRSAVIQELYNLNPDFYTKQFPESLLKRKTYEIDQKSAYYLQKYSNDFLKKIILKYRFNEKGWAFRRYTDSDYYIKNVHLIDFWKWKYIPFLDFSSSVDGADIKKLQLDAARKEES